MDATTLAPALESAGRLVPALLVKAAVVLGAAGLLALALRRRSASARHLVWVTAIAGVLALPAVSLLPFELPVLPVSFDRSAERVASVVGSPSATIPVEVPAEIPGEVRAVESTPAEGYSTLPPVIEPTPASALASRLAAPGWGPVLGAVWLLGVALLLLRMLLGKALLWRMIRTGEPIVDEQWTATADRLARGLDAPSVRLFLSPRTEMPMTWGILRPVVLLPASCTEWSDERREVVLRHELAHVARRDILGLGVAQLACAVHWFNPLSWVALHQLRAEAEKCCDDCVLRTGTRPSTYASHLLEMVHSLRQARVPAGVALPMAQRSTFEGRLLAILEPGLERGALTRRQTALTVAGLAALVVVLGALRPVDAEAVARLAPTTVVRESGSSSATALLESEEERELDVERPSFLEAASSALSRFSLSLSADADLDADPTLGVSALIGALADLDATVRGSAVHQLGELEDPGAVQALIEALRTDADAGVRETAAWALGNVEDRAAVPALMEAMTSDSAIEVRRTAAWALGNIEDASAVDGLTRAVADPDAELRLMAVWALGNIESRLAVPALSSALRQGDVAMRRKAVWALGQIEADEGVAALLEVLGDTDAEVREQAVWALGQIESPDAVAALAQLFGDSDPRVREQVAWALGQIEAESAVEVLSAAVRSDLDVEVRHTAAWALGQIESLAAIDALSDALGDASPTVRTWAAWAIGQAEPVAAPEALIAALRDEDPDVRSMAAWALRQTEDVVGLTELLADPDPEVRAAAIRALGGGRGADPRPAPRPQPRPDPQPSPRG